MSLFFFHFPHYSTLFPIYKYPYDLSLVKHLISPLGVPWHASKGQDFAFDFSYVSLFWDLTHKSISLTSKKCTKHLAKITSFIQLASHSQFLKNDVKSLHGSLSHISFIYLHGHTHLQNLIKYIKSVKNNFTCHWTPTPVLRDLEWWQMTLTQPNFTCSLIPHPTTVDHGIWVDASTDWGIGILLQDRWDTWWTLPCWKDKGRDISWLEGVAMELVVNILHLSNISNVDVLIQGDNQGIIGAFKKGCSHNKIMNKVIQRSKALIDSSNLSITLMYIETSINLADTISQGSSSLYRNIYLYLTISHKLSHNTFTMPNAPTLLHLLKDVDIKAEASHFTVIMNHMLNRSSTSTILAPRTQVPRKPQKKKQIVPSVFHPHVWVSERLQQWTSPHPLDFHQSIQNALLQSTFLKSWPSPLTKAPAMAMVQAFSTLHNFVIRTMFKPNACLWATSISIHCRCCRIGWILYYQ